jgi:hypothetical protein
LSIRESLLGPNHHLVAEVLKYLGILYFNPFYVENLEEVRRYFEIFLFPYMYMICCH